MSVPISRDRRKPDLRNRLKDTRDDGRRRCWVFGCPNAPGNVSGDGLGRFCRRHLEHHRRHGDPEKPSYKATEVNPYRLSAASWLKVSADHRHVKLALNKVESLMSNAGRNVDVRELKGALPTVKANAMWARLREQAVAPEKVLAAIIGTAMCNASDRDPRKKEYRQVQIAKVLSRMAGGETKRWPTHYTDPTLPKEKVISWYVASEGLVLREAGKKAEDAADYLIHDHMEALLAHHKQRQKAKSQRILKTLPFPARRP